MNLISAGLVWSSPDSVAFSHCFGDNKVASGLQTSPSSCQVPLPPRNLLLQGQILCYSNYFAYLQIAQLTLLSLRFYLLEIKQGRTQFSCWAEVSDLTFLFWRDPQWPLKKRRKSCSAKTFRSLHWLLTSHFYRYIRNCRWVQLQHTPVAKDLIPLYAPGIQFHALLCCPSSSHNLPKHFPVLVLWGTVCLNLLSVPAIFSDSKRDEWVLPWSGFKFKIFSSM